METSSFDAYTPKEIARRVESVAINKSMTDPVKLFVLAILAGSFIALGAALYTLVIHDSSLSDGITRLIGGLSFCLGLILVVVAGAELFTGNNLIVMAFVDQKITLGQVLKNWVIVFVGNFLGALLIVLLVYIAGHFSLNEGQLAQKYLAIASHKTSLGFAQAIALGVLCNILVCIAVWLCFAGHSVTDKILAILFPITAFVALGFEHSVANMYFIPSAIVISQDAGLMQMVAQANPESVATHISLGNFLIDNLLPVTIGNLIGGSVFVGLVYWFIYLKE